MLRFAGTRLASFALCVRSNLRRSQVWRVMFSRPYTYRRAIASSRLTGQWITLPIALLSSLLERIMA
jgi:hypothetical protein